MKTIYLLTGSNIGNSLDYLNEAIQKVSAVVGIISQTSGVYKTEPWGKKDQQDFLNQVLEVQTLLGPEEVLQEVLGIEQKMGRNRIEKWGPRVIDIDLLFYGDMVMQSQRLTIPHPLLHERRFTLLPLSEIAPMFVHPLLNKSVAELLNVCADTSLVEKL